MMLHQDGSRHEWIEDHWWNLIVTMDDANNEIYSAFFVAEEGTMSSFIGVQNVIETHGLFYFVRFIQIVGRTIGIRQKQAIRSTRTIPPNWGAQCTNLALAMIPRSSASLR